MTITDRELGFNIQRARFRAGLSQEAFAEKIGVNRTAVSRIENGQRSVSAIELAVISRLFACEPGELLTPADIDPLRLRTIRSDVLFRTTGVSDGDHPHLSWLVDVATTAPSTNAPLRLPHRERLLNRDPRLSGELAARELRDALALSAHEPVRSASGIGHDLGTPIIGARFPSSSTLSGASLSTGEHQGVVLVNLNHSNSRQRFTAAHEIGHLLLDGADGAVCITEASRPGVRAAKELRADVFASALLMPRELAKTVAQNADGLSTAARQLAAFARVSEGAARARLRGLRVPFSSAPGRTTQRGDQAPRPAAPPYRIMGISLAAHMDSALLDSCTVLPDSEVIT